MAGLSLCRHVLAAFWRVLMKHYDGGGSSAATRLLLQLEMTIVAGSCGGGRHVSAYVCLHRRRLILATLASSLVVGRCAAVLA